MAEDDPSPRRARRWRRSHEEIIVAAVLLVGAIYFRLQIDNFVLGGSGGELGPDFWPGALLTLGIVLSAIYLVLAIIWARHDRADGQVAEPDTALADTAAPAADTAATTATPSTAASTGGAPATAAVGTGTAEPVPTPEAAEHTGGRLKLFGGFALLAGYIYLLAPIGFVPASALFAVAFMLLVGERRWYVLLLFPIVAVAVLLGIFTQLLVVPLPRGTGVFTILSTYLY